MVRRIVLIALVALSPVARAQFDERWAEFVPNPGMLQLPPTAVSTTIEEVTFAHGDLDQDGWLDLVVGRKQSFAALGGRTNLLLMNVNGVLFDRTAIDAAASDLAGDQGFLTSTCDTDVALVDVNGDGWLDVVTAVQADQFSTKAVGHPRVYRNLGVNGGAWQGLRHEDARIPQLLHGTSGLPLNPRFSTVSAGDVDGDGDADLYYCDNDGFIPVFEPLTDDLDDRLLLNDGSGFFSDGSAIASGVALSSGFGIEAELVDLNLDGALDVLKLSPPGNAAGRAIYQFGGLLNAVDPFHGYAPYSMAVGDLNRDGRPDVVFGDDVADRIRYNLSTGVNLQAVWGNPLTFQFLAGGDDGLVGAPEIVDLDADGWDDVLIADADVVIPGFNRRLHIYHNPGGAIGSEIRPVEERQSATSGGWVGAVGFTESDLKGTFETESFDIDRDGDADVVLGRGAGTDVWENITVVCQEDLGFGTAGGATLSMCGNPLKADGTADFSLTAAPPSTPVYVVVGATVNPTPTLGGTLVPGQVALIVQTTTDAMGRLLVPGVGAFGAPLTLVVQCAYVDGGQPTGAGFSNAIRIVSQ